VRAGFFLGLSVVLLMGGVVRRSRAGPEQRELYHLPRAIRVGASLTQDSLKGRNTEMKATTAQVKAGFVSTLLCIPLLCAFAAGQAKPEQAAQQSADAWLALVDSGKYAQSWDEAAQLFKGAVTKDQWQGALHAARDPLGKLVSRKVKSANYTRTLPGVPDGEYVVIQYESSFEHKQSALETVTPMLDKDGKWRVSGYFIK
jgi:hypothetical protein